MHFGHNSQDQSLQLFDLHVTSYIITIIQILRCSIPPEIDSLRYEGPLQPVSKLIPCRREDRLHMYKLFREYVAR